MTKKLRNIPPAESRNYCSTVNDDNDSFVIAHPLVGAGFVFLVCLQHDHLVLDLSCAVQFTRRCEKKNERHFVPRSIYYILMIFRVDSSRAAANIEWASDLRSEFQLTTKKSRQIRRFFFSLQLSQFSRDIWKLAAVCARLSNSIHISFEFCNTEKTNKQTEQKNCTFTIYILIYIPACRVFQFKVVPTSDEHRKQHVA